MKNKQQGSYTLFGLGVFALWLAVVIGWIINIVDVVQMAAANLPVTTLFVVKAVGILLFPLGAVCGLFF